MNYELRIKFRLQCFGYIERAEKTLRKKEENKSL
jgi:hypothetical protein